jgi:hypothetical protein
MQAIGLLREPQLLLRAEQIGRTDRPNRSIDSSIRLPVELAKISITASPMEGQPTSTAYHGQTLVARPKASTVQVAVPVSSKEAAATRV